LVKHINCGSHIWNEILILGNCPVFDVVAFIGAFTVGIFDMWIQVKAIEFAVHLAPFGEAVRLYSVAV
jgi:hypothetical protein